MMMMKMVMMTCELFNAQSTVSYLKAVVGSSRSIDKKTNNERTNKPKSTKQTEQIDK